VKAQATKRAMTTATRVASNNKGNGNGDKGCRQVTATRAMAVATAVVGKDEDGGDGDEGGGQQRW
jgi:hypothetical protein